jgi:hypothetical protein
MSDHQVFICHSSLDAATGRDLVAYLEARGVRCWISSRDVAPGENFQAAIVRAIRSARILLLMFSEASNRSNEVPKELALASSFDLTVLPLRLAAVRPNEALLYELATRQWVDGWPDRELAFARLLTVIADVLRRTTTGDPASDQSTRIARPGPLSSAASPPPRGAPMVVAPSAVQELRALLSRHVGPMARMFIDRAIAGESSAEAICTRLAAHLPPTADRDAFLKAARRLLPPGG